MKRLIGAIGFAAFLLAPCAAPTFAEAPAGKQDEHKDQDALLKALAKSKISLADGVRQVCKGDEVAISAKYEFDDAGKLSLSIYTAEKGLGVGAEQNVLKEFSGSPEDAAWKTNVEVFKDVAHVARASQQLTLVAFSKATLLDVIARVEKEKNGRVISIAPAQKDRKAWFVVQVAAEGKIVEKKIKIEDEDDE